MLHFSSRDSNIWKTNLGNYPTQQMSTTQHQAMQNSLQYRNDKLNDAGFLSRQRSSQHLYMNPIYGLPDAQKSSLKVTTLPPPP